MIAELRHDVLHGLLVLLQERSQLLVFLEQRVVLNDDLRILTFEVRLECLCVTKSGKRWRRGSTGTRNGQERTTYLSICPDSPASERSRWRQSLLHSTQICMHECSVTQDPRSYTYFEGLGLGCKGRGHLVVHGILLRKLVQNLPCAYEVGIDIVIHGEDASREHQGEMACSGMCASSVTSRLRPWIALPGFDHSGVWGLRVTCHAALGVFGDVTGLASSRPPQLARRLCCADNSPALTRHERCVVR